MTKKKTADTKLVCNTCNSTEMVADAQQKEAFIEAHRHAVMESTSTRKVEPLPDRAIKPLDPVTFQDERPATAESNREALRKCLQAISDASIAKRTILDEAAAVTSGRAAADYGTVRHDFSRIAALWQVIIDAEPVGRMTPEKVGLAMIAVKVSRQLNKAKHENLVDIAGYARTLEMLNDE